MCIRDSFLAQADLTLMVPGPMTAELAADVALLADLESAGAASVYRVTEDLSLIHISEPTRPY